MFRVDKENHLIGVFLRGCAICGRNKTNYRLINQMLERAFFQVLNYKLPDFIASKLHEIIPLDSWESSAFQVLDIAAGVDYVYITFSFEIMVESGEYLHLSCSLFCGLSICSFMDKYYCSFLMTKQITASLLLKKRVSFHDYH